MKKIPIIIFLCFIAGFVFPSGSVPENPLAADETAAQYKTGTIDPVIALIPPGIGSNVFIKPEIYVKQLVSFLAANAGSDYQIVKRIHDWIDDNIAYQFIAETEVNKFLKTRITNCTGYSYLFKEMAGYAGIQSDVVIGHSKTYKFANGAQGNHAWNVVTIKGKKYLVDTTHDSRMRVRNGIIGEKKPYTDTELFLNPAFKIFINLPYDAKYQLLDKPVTFDQYMSLPRVRLSFFKYGLELTDPSFGKQKIEAPFTWGGNSSIKGSFDGIKTAGESRNIMIKTPQNVELKLEIGNFDTTYNDHTLSYRQGNYFVLDFSAPGKGSFLATVAARYEGDSDWEGVYSIMLVEDKGEGPRIPG